MAKKEKNKNKMEKVFWKIVLFCLLVFLTIIFAVGVGSFFEETILKVRLIYLTVYFLITIPILLILVDKWMHKGWVEKNERLIVVITTILFAFFMLMTFFVASQTHKLTLDQNSPKLNIQLTTMEIPWSEAPTSNFNDYFTSGESNVSSISLPIFLKINNWGFVNTQIYQVNFETECGNNKGSLTLPKNKPTLLKPGNFYELETHIMINPENKTVMEVLPCTIDFYIYGPNFDKKHRRITLNLH